MELIMFVLATVTFTDPSKIGPYVWEEFALLHANRDKGLTLSKKGLMTMEFTELTPF
jgi:hypothetical protein